MSFKRTKHPYAMAFATGVGLLVFGLCVWFFVVPVLFPTQFPTEEVTVNVTGYCREDLIGTASNQLCDIYLADFSQLTDPATRTISTPSWGTLYYLETPTAAGAGLITLATPLRTHTKVYVQARQGNPAAADPYVTPLREFTVPWGEAGNTVSFGQILVRDATPTAPTFLINDQSGQVISNTAGDKHAFNITDSVLTFKLLHTVALSADTWWGSEDFVDYQTGYQYYGGILVIQSRIAQPINPVGGGFSTNALSGNCWFFSAGGVCYYIYKIGGFCNTTASLTDGTLAYTITVTTPWIADAPVNSDSLWMDCFDCQRADTMPQAVFAGLLNVAVIWANTTNP